ncbi:hypothetical protein ACIQCR_31200 [Streptomyces sp. NPDC093249]|uniref:hypothetical protein n=1 Tax=unclassified Streptomyces TaxID=2593676 RepID=UPI0034505FCB
MKNGHENLAHLAEASLRVSLAAVHCVTGITGRTDALLYEDSDETAQTSRDYLANAVVELDQAARKYGGLAQHLSRRLASAVAQAEDRPRIERALAEGRVTATPVPGAPTAPAGQTRHR